MMIRTVAFLCLFCAYAMSEPNYSLEEPLLYDTFPSDFLWGTATASYQIEGGWNDLLGQVGTHLTSLASSWGLEQSKLHEYEIIRMT